MSGGRHVPWIVCTDDPRLRDGTRNSMRLHDWGQKHRPRPGSPILFY